MKWDNMCAACGTASWDSVWEVQRIGPGFVDGGYESAYNFRPSRTGRFTPHEVRLHQRPGSVLEHITGIFALLLTFNHKRT